MKQQAKWIWGVVGILTLAITLVTSGFLYVTGDASRAELAYAEYSLVGKEAGSVIPASCNSIPPYSHRAGDCPQMCEMSPNPDVRNNTVYSAVTNSCVCKDGSKNNPPSCDEPSVKLFFDNSDNNGGSSRFADFIVVDLSAASGEFSPNNPLRLSWNAIGPRGMTCVAASPIGFSGEVRRSGEGSYTIQNECVRTGSKSISLTCSAPGIEPVKKVVYARFVNSAYDVCECDPFAKNCGIRE